MQAVCKNRALMLEERRNSLTPMQVSNLKQPNYHCHLLDLQQSLYPDKVFQSFKLCRFPMAMIVIALQRVSFIQRQKECMARALDSRPLLAHMSNTVADMSVIILHTVPDVTWIPKAQAEAGTQSVQMTAAVCSEIQQACSTLQSALELPAPLFIAGPNLSIATACFNMHCMADSTEVPMHQAGAAAGSHLVSEAGMLVPSNSLPAFSTNSSTAGHN